MILSIQHGIIIIIIIISKDYSFEKKNPNESIKWSQSYNYVKQNNNKKLKAKRARLAHLA